MIPMKAKRRFVYAGHNYVTGDEFSAHSESNARFLTQVGHAERVQRAIPVYHTRVLTPAVPAPAPVAPAVVAPKADVQETEPKAETVKRGPGRPRKVVE